MGLMIGIVGKSNTGKSTIFKAMTLVDVEISNRIFTTIRPNQGVGYVTADCPCKKRNVCCSPNNSECRDGKRHVPVKLVDVAGLVPDAHKGRGLGVQFLSDIMEASGLIQIVDSSGGTDEEGNPVSPGSHDPSEEIEFLPNEVAYWMLGILKKNWDQITKKSRSSGQKTEELLYSQLSGLKIPMEDIEAAMKKEKIDGNSGDSELLGFVKALRERAKPIIIAANKIDIPASEKNIERMKERYGHVVPTSAESELALREAGEKGLIEYRPGESGFTITSDGLSEKQKKALDFIRENVLSKYGSTGVQDVLNRLVFDVLDHIVVYPVASIGRLCDTKGNVLPDAHLVRKGTTLRELAGKVHSDISDKFIGGLNTERKKVGSDYELKDGDVIEILFSK